MGLILFILILKVSLILQFIWAFNISGPISTYFNSKVGLYSTSYEIGLFSGLDSKLILLTKVGLILITNGPRIILT